MPAAKTNFKLVFMAASTLWPKIRPGRTMQSRNCHWSAEPYV